MSYPASKAAASVAFPQWAIEHKLKLKYLRIFQVFGKGEEANRLWPSLKKAAIAGQNFHLTPGEQVRDFTPIEEVAKQMVYSLDFSEVNAGIPLLKNIGTNKPQSIKQFAEYWWVKSYRKNEVMRFVPEINKIIDRG